MKHKYIYVRAEVLPADPGRVNLLSGLCEKTGGAPQPDVVPHTDPGAISFRHAHLEAADDNDAYARGSDMLPAPAERAVINDYVIRVA